jgi:hypothetical protein
MDGWVRAAGGLFCAALLLTALVINQSAVHWRDNRADDHLFVYGGWRILHGDRPYANVWDNKPPCMWWVNALALGIGGEGLLPPIVAAAAAQLLRGAAFVFAARLAFGPGMIVPAALLAAAALTHLRYECGGNRAETYVAALEVGGVAMYLHWLRRGALGWLLAAALVLGTAPWFKQNGIGAGVACGVHLLAALVTRRLAAPGGTALMVYGVGVCLPGLIVVAALTAQGVLAPAWEALVTFNGYYFRVGDASWTNVVPRARRYLSMLQPVAPVLWLALLGVVSGLALFLREAFRVAPAGYGPKHDPLRRCRAASATVPEDAGPAAPWRADAGPDARLPVASLASLWLVADIYLACVGAGRQNYHLSPVLTPLALLALYPIGVWLRGEPLRFRILQAPSTAALLVLYAAASASLVGGSLEEARRCWRKKPVWYALETRPTDDEELRGAAIRAWTKRSDKVYVWGWSPGTYRFAYRKCPSRFATLEAVSHIAPYGEFLVHGAIRDLHADPPAVFVISPGDYEGLSPGMAEWLSERYLLRDTIAGMHLLARADI